MLFIRLVKDNLANGNLDNIIIIIAYCNQEFLIIVIVKLVRNYIENHEVIKAIL